MAHQYRFHRPTEHLEYYLLFEPQGSPPPPNIQPALVSDLIPISADEPLPFAAGEVDIRQFSVNTPTGNPLGKVVGYLTDAAHDVIPFAYVQLADERIVVVPTNQLTIFAERRLTTLEGGLEALCGAPEANFDYHDAQHASRYWIEYRQRNAA